MVQVKPKKIQPKAKAKTKVEIKPEVKIEQRKVSLTAETISHEEIDSLCDWLKTYPKLTKGKLTQELEFEFAESVEAGGSVFVNSGSSANLLMFATLLDRGLLKRGDKVGISGLCWSTDLSPIIQLGLIPVLLDISPMNLGIETKFLAAQIQEFDIKCVISVSVLGIPGDIEDIASICARNGVILLEDNCESLGSRYRTKPLGAFGLMSSWSTYFSHHISTIEGGFVTFNNPELNDSLVSIRSHGWKREEGSYDYLTKHDSYRLIKDGVENPGKLKINDSNKDKYEDFHIRTKDLKYSGRRMIYSYRDSGKNITEFNFPYTFYSPGFNIRNTEIGAFLGLSQLKKLPDIVNKRFSNFQYYCKQIQDWVNFHNQHDFLLREFSPMYFTDRNADILVSSFALPLIHRNRDKIVKALNDGGVECRPLIAGNIAQHPIADRYEILNRNNSRNLNLVHNFGFYMPNHMDMGTQDIDYIVNIIKGVE